MTLTETLTKFHLLDYVLAMVEQAVRNLDGIDSIQDADVAELQQDVFLRLLNDESNLIEKIRGAENHKNRKAFLNTAIHRRASRCFIDTKRRIKRNRLDEITEFNEPDEAIGHPQSSVEERDLTVGQKEFLKFLPKHLRRPISFAIHGFTTRETARKMRVSQTIVVNRLQEAKQFVALSGKNLDDFF